MSFFTDECKKEQPVALMPVLKKLIGRAVNRAECQIKQLEGGTLGDVRLVTGVAETAEGDRLPYQVVWKKQDKWERPGDPDSWRREFDLYQSSLGAAFTSAFRWPACYHSELRNDTTELWIEYIDGISGGDLTIEMLERAALELGRFQGRIANEVHNMEPISCLGDVGFFAREFSQWHTQSYTFDFLVSEQCRLPGFLKELLKNGDIQLTDGKSLEYGYLRSRSCSLPIHIKQMIMDLDERKEECIETFHKLPILLCHRDFWHENIFYADGAVRLIDWDTAGWGFLGEDIASLIADDMDPERFEENDARLIPAYLKGLSEYMDVPAGDALPIWDMILIKFGYRMIQEVMFSKTAEEKSKSLSVLQKAYEMNMRGR